MMAALEWDDLSIGNLLTGEKLTWDELRQILIVSTPALLPAGN
jgi:hypothetical protein